MIAAFTVVIAVIYLAGSSESVWAQDPAPNQEMPARAASSFWPSTLKDWASVVQAAVTFSALVIGGWFAWKKLEIFRAREPHVTISHDISHRLVGSKYTHIAVTAILHNTSRVNVEFFGGLSSIQRISPSPDEDIEQLYEEVFVVDEQEYIQWTTLEQIRRSWKKDGLIVEPGESETEMFEFLVSADVKSIAITTYFYNSRVLGKIADMDMRNAPRLRGKLLRWQEARGPRGWNRTTIYDIL